MKYIKSIVYVSILSLLLVAVGCDNIDDSRFKSSPEEGWVQFGSSGTTVNAATTAVTVPIEINVPEYRSGIEIRYEFVPVSGDFNQIIVNDPGTSVFEPALESDRRQSIELEIAGVSDLTEQVIFDIVLTSTSVGTVSVGVDESTPTVYRISTPCPLDYNALAGSYAVDEVFTDGINAGLSLAAAFGESYQMEVSLDPTDITESRVILNNAAGADVFIPDGTTMSFDTCNGTVTFDPLPVNLAAFADMAITSAVYTEDPPIITVSGTLGNFGPYEFILTKE